MLIIFSDIKYTSKELIFLYKFTFSIFAFNILVLHLKSSKIVPIYFNAFSSTNLFSPLKQFIVFYIIFLNKSILLNKSLKLLLLEVSFCVIGTSCHCRGGHLT